ncbi:hypothetical protein PIIN_09672 [Serendipita indica DSM 11827]|uniref:Lysine-specific metallo-endopeptidase domain-containing protein n=1 Tax=Serendipita indica (strain DSM 11827) TaxID=1109443 RepID=G4TWI9_SERID|nr:hypothetical protein PIIN_09672 [Serendipita indica DSM 11827]
MAYIVPTTLKIYYCSIFYNEVTTSHLCSDTSVASRDIRGGTTFHELTHALSNTDNVGYGCTYDQSLASSNPPKRRITLITTTTLRPRSTRTRGAEGSS